MSKIERYQGNVHAFASGAQGVERTVFGETTQANDLTSQITAAFLRGWGIVGPSEHPSLEDFNGAMYALSQFIAYQHQAGIPEWHEEQEYYVGSICTHNGESYQSLVDANVGNEPPTTAWTPILTSNNGLQNLGLGTAAQLAAPSASFGENGWLKLPVLIGTNEMTLIVQWAAGTAGGSNSTGLVCNFPFTFPNQVFTVMTGNIDTTYTASAIPGTIGFCSLTKSSITAKSSLSTSEQFYYLVIGY